MSCCAYAFCFLCAPRVCNVYDMAVGGCVSRERIAARKYLARSLSYQFRVVALVHIPNIFFSVESMSANGVMLCLCVWFSVCTSFLQCL